MYLGTKLRHQDNRHQVEALYGNLADLLFHKLVTQSI